MRENARVRVYPASAGRWEAPAGYAAFGRDVHAGVTLGRLCGLLASAGLLMSYFCDAKWDQSHAASADANRRAHPRAEPL